MYHVILIAIMFTIMLAMWTLVHASPRSLAMFLPREFTFFAGTFFLLFGIFFAYLSAYPLQNAPGMLSFIIKAHVGLWLLLAHIKGDEEIVRRGFLMMGTLLLILLGIYYAQNPLVIALITLFGVTAGYWITAVNPRFVDTVADHLRNFRR
jgi:hypothetical protein